MVVVEFIPGVRHLRLIPSNAADSHPQLRSSVGQVPGPTNPTTTTLPSKEPLAQRSPHCCSRRTHGRRPSHDGPNKCRVVPQITLGQPTRLLDEAEDPSDSVALHPQRCLRQRSGVNIESSSTPKMTEDRSLPTWDAIHRSCFGVEQAYPYQVRSAVVDLRDDRVIFGRRELSERRGVGADDLKRRKSRGEPSREAFPARPLDHHRRTTSNHARLLARGQLASGPGHTPWTSGEPKRDDRPTPSACRPGSPCRSHCEVSAVRDRTGIPLRHERR